MDDIIAGQIKTNDGRYLEDAKTFDFTAFLSKSHKNTRDKKARNEFRLPAKMQN